MKISKKRLTEIILQECEMANEPHMDHDVPEMDNEGEFAKRQLQDMEKYARELSEMLTDTTQLESWVQAKLTKAVDYLKTVKHYVEYGMEEGAYDQVGADLCTMNSPMGPIEDESYSLEDDTIIKMLEKMDIK